MSTENFSFVNGPNGEVIATGEGGPNNFSYKMTYGGFNGTYTSQSPLKEVKVSQTQQETVINENNILNIKLDNSISVGELNQLNCGMSVRMVGTPEQLDGVDDCVLDNSLTQFNALRSSVGNSSKEISNPLSLMSNLADLDVEAMLSKCTASPKLEPLPPATSIFNLPKVLTTLAMNTATQTAADLAEAQTMFPKIVTEMKKMQDEEAESIEASGDEGDESGSIFDSVTSMVSDLFTTKKAYTEPNDEWTIDDEAIVGALEEYLKNPR